MSDELFHTIALLETLGVGNMRARKLIEYFGSATQVLALGQKVLMEATGIGPQLAEAIASGEGLIKAEKEIKYIEKNNIKIITEDSGSYPDLLKQCFDRPVLMYAFGSLTNLPQKVLGVVGTRNITGNGTENCRKLVQGLHESGTDCAIVSGLAFGADACAHTTALEFGLPTVGVLAHGLDMIYPKNHAALARKIVDAGGALLTEYIPHSILQPENFVDRNRIIAGMSQAVVVVESAAKGGSLVTAEFANNYNREVFAYPGRVGDKYSQGCNMLIKNNKAALIESHEDLILYMNWAKSNKKKAQQLSLFNELTPEEQNIAIHKLSVALLEMEFKGLVKTLPGKRYALTV